MASFSRVLPITFIFIISLSFSVESIAAGYAIKEQSASAQGASFAGASATTEDISTMFFNPASIGKHKGSQALSSFAYINPKIRIKEATATSATFGDVSGQDQEDAAGFAVVPSFYSLWDLNEDFNLGIAVNSPWGLQSKYNPNSVFRYEAVRSSIKTVNLSGALSYNFSEQLSVAVGPQIQYLEAVLSKSANCAPLIGQPAYTADCLIDNRGDDVGFGFLAGIHYEVDKWKLGLGFRSEIDHEVKGKTRISRPSAALAATFPDTTVSTDVTTPAMINFGVEYAHTDRLSFLGEIQQTNWSVFDKLVLNFGNSVGGNNSSTVPENWEDSLFYSLGFSYKTHKNAMFRMGVAFDESPVPDEFRNPTVPDSDRTWVSLGFSLEHKKNLLFDLGYTHIFLDGATVNKEAESFTGTNLRAKYESNIDILSAQMRYKF